MPPNETTERAPGLFTRFRRWFSQGGVEERAFLPSALEFLETPASPAARIVAFAIVAFFAIGVVWASFGEVDIVAVAQGRIIPKGGVQSLQPLEMGVVRAIHVREGQEVVKGEVLIELDPTESEVDKGQVTRELMSARVEIARLKAHLRILDGAAPMRPRRLSELGFKPPAKADPRLARMHRQRLGSDLLAHQARLAALASELSRRIAEGAAIKAEIEKLTATIPLIEEREKSIERLMKRGNAPRRQWLELRQLLIESRQDLVVQKHRLSEADAARISADRQRGQAEADARRQVLAEMVEARDRIETAELALRKAEKRERLQHLRSPVDGVVQQLQIHTIGGVVTPAQPLMSIVPKNAPLEIEVMVLNKDKGFVEARQRAEIKVEAFPFTKYGTIDGTVTQLSGDAIQDEKLGLVYAARVSMDRTTMRVKDRTVKLTPGMAATIEIKTGKRRIIEFLMTPLLRYRDESLRER